MATVAVPTECPLDLVSRATSTRTAIQNGRPAIASIAGAIEAAAAHFACASRPVLAACAPLAAVSSLVSYTFRHWQPHFSELATVILAFTTEKEAEIDISISNSYGGSWSDTVIIPPVITEPVIIAVEIECGAGTAALTEVTTEIELERTTGSELTRLIAIAVAVWPQLPEVTT